MELRRLDEVAIITGSAAKVAQGGLQGLPKGKGLCSDVHLCLVCKAENRCVCMCYI